MPLFIALMLPGAAISFLLLFWVWYEDDLKDWRKIDWLFPIRGRWLRRGLMICLGTLLMASAGCLALWLLLVVVSTFAYY